MMFFITNFNIHTPQNGRKMKEANTQKNIVTWKETDGFNLVINCYDRNALDSCMLYPFRQSFKSWWNQKGTRGG